MVVSFGNSDSYDGGLSSLTSANAGADGCNVFCCDDVAGISSVVPSSAEPPSAVVRVAFDRRLFEFPAAVLDVDSAMKQSLICQQSQRHDPTPTNVNINDVSALIIMSVLFGIGSLDVMMIGGSSEKSGDGQLMMPSLANTSEMQALSSHLSPPLIVSQSAQLNQQIHLIYSNCNYANVVIGAH